MTRPGAPSNEPAASPPAGWRRGAALFAVLVVHALAAYLLLSGLAVRTLREVAATIEIAAVPLPPPPAEPPLAEPEPEGAAGAAAEEADPPPMVAPPEIIVEDPPRPAPPAPAPAEGRDESAGAADLPGPGSAAGGAGAGMGRGDAGFGTGGGGASPAELIAGEIDGYYPFPPDLLAARRSDTAEYRFIVLPSGRIFGCRPQRTSGSAALDAYMCRLLEERLRYEPARDAAGRPIADEKAYRQEWAVRR